MNKVNILGVLVDKYTISEASDKIVEYLDSDRFHMVFTPNSEILMQAYRDEAFKDLLNQADILSADGIGVVYASRIVGNPISERAAGYDISCSVLDKIKSSKHSVFLFGSKPGVAELAKANLEAKYPGLNIAGCRNGYFGEADVPNIIKEINDSGADMLFVCLGAPKQEKWIFDHKDELMNVKVAIGAGGSLDVFAGTVERAPEFFCKTGLEWFYRLCKEPKRAGRMLDLPRFAVTVIKNGKKFKN